MDKPKIRNGFSRAARQYDKHAWLPQEVGQRLWRLVSACKRSLNVLDIGCGTGAFTVKLNQKFKRARVIGFDLAEGMIGVARGRATRNGEIFLQADLKRMPFKAASFDVAISNLVYQRIGNLGVAFKRVNNLLIPRGKFYLSLMTAGTLYELQSSFISVYKNNIKFVPKEAYRHPLPSRVIKALESSGFRIIRSAEFKRIKYYSKSGEIVKWLKSIGANDYYRNRIRGLCFRKLLKQMEKVYRERYSHNGKIAATFCGMIIAAQKR